MGDGLICAIFLHNASKLRGSGCPSFPSHSPHSLISLIPPHSPSFPPSFPPHSPNVLATVGAASTCR